MLAHETQFLPESASQHVSPGGAETPCGPEISPRTASVWAVDAGDAGDLPSLVSVCSLV